jgi:hypothetical protein
MHKCRQFTPPWHRELTCNIFLAIKNIPVPWNDFEQLATQTKPLNGLQRFQASLPGV